MHNGRNLPSSLDLLRGFEAAARHLSFTAAGEELFITQSAVSRQVQTLEEQLGVKLFERRTRALALTQSGEAYYRDVAKVLQQLREATARVRAATDRRVRVTTTVTFSSLWLVPRLASFQSRFGDISVHIHTASAVSDLERDGFDVAVRYTTADSAGKDALMLFNETVAPVCSPSLLQGVRIEKPADLLALPLLHFADAHMATPWLSWEAWCEAMHVELPANARSLTFTHYDQLIQGAVAGHGVALGRFPVTNQLIDDGRLVCPLAGAGTSAHDRAFWLVVASVAAERPEVKTFVEWLKGEIHLNR